jgi:hypothetical protein
LSHCFYSLVGFQFSPIVPLEEIQPPRPVHAICIANLLPASNPIQGNLKFEPDAGPVRTGQDELCFYVSTFNCQPSRAKVRILKLLQACVV